MEELYEYRRRLIERYSAVASDLAAALERNHPADLSTAMNDIDPSPGAIVAHLLEAERGIFFPYLLKLLDEDLPCLEDAQATHETHAEGDRSAELVTGLEKFQQLRAQQVKLLLSLPLESWSRCGRHSAFGVRTLQWWVEHSLAHADTHLRRGGR